MAKRKENSESTLEGSYLKDDREAKIAANPPQEDINRGYSREPARIKERVVENA